MPAYQTSAFQVELPDNFEDASTYAFVFPGGSPDFNRSVVIKKDPSEAMVDLVAYMVTQRGKLRQGADGFEIVGEWQSRQGGYEVVTTVFEWNPNVKRIRQKQWYFHLPGQTVVWTLTATDLAPRFGESEAFFDRVAASFVPAK